MRNRAWRARVAGAWLLAVPGSVAAQDWLGLHGLFDVEGWWTSGSSTLLSRERRGALVGRGYLLWVVEPRAGLQIVGGNEVEGATDEDEVELEIDHLTLRAAPAPWLIVDAGKFAHPVGAFAARRFSNINPLIGRPDGYPVTYPLGLMVSGVQARFDYRAALVTLPPSSPDYLPEPGVRLRPAAGVGFTPFIGLRLGGSWTAGPYLHEDFGPVLPAGSRWQDFGARIVAGDLRFARGYFELFAELAASWYEVPTYANEVKGTTYYVEAKYTWSPRLFTAARFERNLYAFIQVRGGAWQARATDFINGEVAVGYRLTTHALLKVSYRADDWDIAPAQQAFLGEGQALALQFSYQMTNR